MTSEKFFQRFILLPNILTQTNIVKNSKIETQKTKMWKKIKQVTSRTVERVKQKGGNELEKANPDYDAACEKYKSIKDHITLFIDNIEKLATQLSKVPNGLNDLSKNVERDTQNLETAREISPAFTNLLNSMAGVITDQSIKRIREEILQPIKDLETKFKEYHKMKVEHKDLNLLLSSNKEKLEKLVAKNKEPEKIAEYQRKVESKTDQLNSMEAQFIHEMEVQWANRFYTLHKPFILLSQIMFEFITSACDQSQKLQQDLGGDVLSRDYPASASA